MMTRAALLLQQYPKPTREQTKQFAETVMAEVEEAMRATAREQQQRRLAEWQARPNASGRPPRKPAVLSVIDGWHWRPCGRPSQYSAAVLLLRVEEWAVLASAERPTERRLHRSEALAEVLLEDARREAPETYARVEAVRQRELLAKCPPPQALVRAVTEVIGDHFRSLQSRFSQLLGERRAAADSGTPLAQKPRPPASGILRPSLRRRVGTR